MTGRMKLMLGTVFVLAGALAIDRLVLTDDSSLVTPRPDITIPPLRSSSRASPLLPAATVYSEIWQRPLFNPDRKAATMIATTRLQLGRSENTSSDQPPNFTIVGVAIRPDGGSILVKKSRREIVRVMVGDQVEGWSIDALHPDHVTVSRDGESWQIPVGGKP